MTTLSNNASHAGMLLNKTIEDGNFSVLARYGIAESDMPTDIDRNAYKFIKQYVEANGDMPSYASVASGVEGFNYIPEVSDSYEYLAKQVKGFSAKQRILELFETGEFNKKLNELDGNEFVSEWLPSQLGNIASNTNIAGKVGSSVKHDIQRYKDEYQRRKEGTSFKVWDSAFSAVGQYTSGNMYTLIGESGRGKSIVATEEGVEMAMQGATVLVWSMEMLWYELAVRIYTSISGRIGVTKRVIKGERIEAGFDSAQLRSGNMPKEFEDAMFAFMDNISEYIPGDIIIRASDDKDFIKRDLHALRADIETVGADVVIIDPFYYLDYSRNTSKTAGGDASATSSDLRRLTGTQGVVTIAITQSDLADTESSADRALKMPKRSEVKKTKSLLEDSAITIGVDSNYLQGAGIIGALKGRDGGEGNVSNILYLPNYGIVRELEVGEEALEDFDF